MKIGVLLKIVPDTYVTPDIKDDNSGVTFPDDTEYVRDRYSEFAVEEAVKTAETVDGDNEVVSFTITESDQKKSLRKALAMGVDRAIVIENEELFNSDPLSIARALAKEVEDEKPDILFAGKLSSDIGNQFIGQAVASILDIPVIGEVRGLEISDTGVKATRKVGNREETFETNFPVVIITEKGLNEPRYPKLPDIMKAKRKPTDWKEKPQTEIRKKSKRVHVQYPKEEDTETVMLTDEDGSLEERIDKVVEAMADKGLI